MSEPTPLEYAVYGVLVAAKHETGQRGARRAYRVWERLDASQEDVNAAIVSLLERGWVRQLPPVLTMIHYEAVIPDA